MLTSEQDGTIAVTSPQQLALPAQDLLKIKPVTVLAKIGEGLLRSH